MRRSYAPKTLFETKITKILLLYNNIIDKKHEIIVKCFVPL